VGGELNEIGVEKLFKLIGEGVERYDKVWASVFLGGEDEDTDVDGGGDRNVMLLISGEEDDGAAGR
jgi:hypothetical protein